MFIPEDKDVFGAGKPPRPNDQQTDRVNGEFHYKNGFTQKIYSDAHYVREEDSTVPPRYYCPPEKAPKEPKEPKAPKAAGQGRAVKLCCLCLACALLGGIGGAFIVSSRWSARMSDMETKMDAMYQQQAKALCGASAENEGCLSGEQIYAMAKRQTVNIAVESQSLLGFSDHKASGSGVILTEDGYIATNHHVIAPGLKEGNRIMVRLYDGGTYPATLIASAQENDIAVIKIDTVGLSPVSFGNSDDLGVGQLVYAVGNPTGQLDWTMTTGHISALDREISPEELDESIRMFQMDAAVNSGNSGGPVYDEAGRVVGLVTAKFQDPDVEGIGFAIPSNDVASISDDLMTNGYVTGRAYMGVLLDERYNAIYSQFYNMPMGAYIYSVERGSCAERAGLCAGDIITRLGETQLTGYEDMRKALRNYSAGDSAEMDVYRAGEQMKVSITFDELTPKPQSEDSSDVVPALTSDSN